MSVYGPKLELPQMPEIDVDPKILVGALVVIIIIIIGVILFSGIFNFSPAVAVSWNNNPLNLKDNPSTPAELVIDMTNTQKETADLNFTVETESNEIIVFCPYKSFTNVAPRDTRRTSCIVRRNPDSTIFTGTYTIHIKTNLGDTTTTLEVITK